jgi:hypothetical protein
MIHQFTPRYALPKYWLDENEARQALLKRGETGNRKHLQKL